MTCRVIVLKPLTARAALLVLALLASACSASRSPDPPDRESAQVPSQPLWGDMKPVVSVKELMKYTIDPVADNVFNAVGSTLTKKGMVEWEPKTEEDWEKVSIGAVSLAEAIYLLKVPRPFAPAGDLNNSTGPDAVELSPAEITAKVERDPVEWNARIETLRNASLAVMEVVKKKDAAGMWEAGEILDQACEACHRVYWYPGENAEFYGRLRQRLDQYTQEPPVGKIDRPRSR
jgi:cytochrome c556